ncbi:hypothetical protein ACEPAF_9696 [Sanghuangporus sanghuang]
MATPDFPFHPAVFLSFIRTLEIMPPVSGSPTTAAPGVVMPSEINVDGHPEDADARAHIDHAVPQQGAPEPGSGTVVVDKDKVPFKDQVFGEYQALFKPVSLILICSLEGYTKTIRGTVFRKPETKEVGDKILNGEMSARNYLDQKKATKEEESS